MVRPRFRCFLAAFVVFWLLCGGVGIVGADGGAPGEPASFYGEAIEDDGSEIPAGVTIVAVVDGETKDEINLEDAGSYGGPRAFDDKLRIDSSTGDEVTFRLAGSNGTVGGTAPLESGLFEENLTFPDGSVESLPPEPEIDLDPSEAETGDPITFSAVGSTAYGDTEIDAFEWSIERGGETIDTFDGERVDRSIEEPGAYDARLNVTDDNGRTASETAELEIDGTEPEDGTTADGGEGSASSTDDGSASSGDGSDGTSSGESSGGGTSGESSSGGSSSSDGGPSGTSGGGSSGGSGSSGDSAGSDDLPDSIDSTPGPVLSETHDIDDQFPETPGSSVVFEETSIREIVFEERAVSGDISIAEFEKPTEGTPPIPENGLAASASVISVPETHRETNATVRAAVSDEWLLEQGLGPENLTMYRLPSDGDSWEALPTETFEIDDGYMVEATTPGFSQFVVAGSEPPSREGSESETSAEGSDTTSEETSAGGDVSEPTGEATSGSNDGSGSGGTTPFVPIAALCALLVAVAAIGRLFVPRRRGEW